MYVSDEISLRRTHQLYTVHSRGNNTTILKKIENPNTFKNQEAKK